MVEVDSVKLQNINEFVERVCTLNRVQQGMQETNCDSRSKTGDFMRWFANDVIAEESDILTANDLTWKDVARKVSDKARQLMFHELDSNI